MVANTTKKTQAAGSNTKAASKKTEWRIRPTAQDLYLNFARFDHDVRYNPTEKEFHIPGLESIVTPGKQYPGVVITAAMVVALFQHLDQKTVKELRETVLRLEA